MRYKVAYKMYQFDKVHTVEVEAPNKVAAWDAVMYGYGGESYPYSAWVESVTYKNGRAREFNTFEGKPY